MLITTGKVRGGSIKVNAKDLPEGANVTVLAQEGDETVELGPEDEARLWAAIAEAERVDVSPASKVLRHAQ